MFPRSDEVNAILEKALELKNGELSGLARELHKRLFGANALARLEPYEEEAVSTAASVEPGVPPAEAAAWQPDGSLEPLLSSAKVKYIVGGLFVSGLFVAALLFMPKVGIIPQISSGRHAESPASAVVEAPKPVPPNRIIMLDDLGIHILQKGGIGINIAKGSSLTGISEKYYDNASPEIAKKIAELNGISDFDKIDAKTELMLPHHIVHIVQEGETFSGIAYLYNIREGVLRSMNSYFCSMSQYGERNEYILLRPGDEIVIAVRKSITEIREAQPAKTGELIHHNNPANTSI